MTAPTKRLEVRLDAADKKLIERAAQLRRETMTAFVLRNAREAARETLRREQVTTVPSDFYDQMIASLDAQPAPNGALTDAARRLRDSVDGGGE